MYLFVHMVIINALNETEHAYSLELELNPTFCRFVVHFVFFCCLCTCLFIY